MTTYHLNKAKLIFKDVRESGLDGAIIRLDSTDTYSSYHVRYLMAVSDSELREATERLFRDGHYPQAVSEAFKCLNNYIKKKVKSPKDGSSLMKEVFSAERPRLKINNMRSESDRSEQLGYMEIFSGCMTGIRNPRAHEHKVSDSPDDALVMLGWANHLMMRAKAATRTRNPRKT